MKEKYWAVGGTLLALFLLPVASLTGSSEVSSEIAKPHQSAAAVSTVQGSVVISGVTLTKGAPRETVIRQLSRLYQLQKLKSEQGEEDSWLISEKAETDNYVGVVSFAEGKVRRVARFRKWTQDDDSVELAQRLCDLLEKLTKERGSQANIVARTTDSGKVSVLDRVPESIRTTVRNNGGGHANHSFFWQVMQQNSTGQPKAELAKAIDTRFGSFSAFQEQFTKAALSVFGSGWAWLSLDRNEPKPGQPVDGRENPRPWY